MAAAKRILCRTVDASGNATPRVMNVEKEPVVSGCGGSVERRSRHSGRVVLRQCKYLNNVIEQAHRTGKTRVAGEGDAAGKGLFIAWLFGITA